jgi:SNF2 family DNA or RNA helicase
MLPYPKTKYPPWPHQEKAWKLAQTLDNLYLAFDMGTGKTKTAIDIINGLNLKTVLVLCPKKPISVWKKQIPEHSDTFYKVVAPETGTIKQKAQAIESEISIAQSIGCPVAVVLNYESFWRPPLGPTHNKAGRITDPGLLMRIKWDAIILDEGHRIKSPGGKASWAAAKLGKKTKHRYILSGTPQTHSPLDLYAQFRFLDPDVFGSSFVNFRARYAELVPGLTFPKIRGYKNLDELSQKFYSRAIRVEKRDVLKDLPPVMHEIITCDLGQQARRYYDQLEKDFELWLKQGETVTATNALVKLLRLSQMAGGFVTLDDSGDTKLVDTAKIDSLVETLEDLPPGEPVVIFYNFTPEAKEIKKRIEANKDMGRKCGEISGKVNDEQKWIDGQIDTLLVQIKAGGEGLDSLKRACYGFFFSKGMLSSGAYEQAVARLDRPGQTRPVTFYHIIANNTVDEKIERAIKTGQNLVDQVMKGNWDKAPFSTVINNAINVFAA